MSAFEDFIQVELPRRPWVATDPAEETVPVRRGAGPRQLEFIELTDGQVLGKVAGTIQGVDITSLSGKTYIHTEAISTSMWTVNHNLNSDDYVAFVVDDTGVQLFPDSITAIDVNTVLVDFNVRAAGKVVFVFAS